MDVEVSLRQITQQVLPDGFPATPLWAYGNPNVATTYNNPSFTFEITRDVVTKVKWTNDLVDEENNFLPHIIQDENGTPIIDQTLHWAAPNQDCLDGIPRTDCRGASSDPYTGPVPMVVHVHGAHVGPESDGYPEAWWLPAADNIPEGYATEGTFFASADDGTGEGDADFVYTNDQPSSTLWYHDHSLGMTRLNVYAAGAGFWLIREANDGESGLLSGVLPGPAPQAGQDPNGDFEVRKLIREIPIAIQPKSFNADGTQYYPADRAFFEGLGTGATFNDNTDLNIPFLPANSSDIAPAWNPEAFFNTMVVNGRTWPVLEVAPERYRLRFVNASDSRFMNLSLFTVDQNGNKLQELPFYQIGSDQGLLPEVVQIETGFATVVSFGDPLPTGDQGTPGTFAEQALLLGPAERPDVIVDFTGLPSGTIVRMFNTAPDAPFGGFPDIPADPATTGQVMQFVVNNDLMNPTGDPSSAPNELKLDKDPGGEARFKKADVVRDLALLEEESALLCVTVDAVTGRIDLDEGSVPPLCDPVLGSVPFAPKAAVLGVNGSMGGVPQLWDDPIAQNPQLGNVEQ
ncbi:MAG: copper oxidase, partial [Gammaproteobacteria bacterium]